MDTLLLLCNLHADGPATWRRLARRGVRDVSELELVEVERLAEWLGGSPASARRFVREARRLAGRAEAVATAVAEPARADAARALEREEHELATRASDTSAESPRARDSDGDGDDRRDLEVARATSCGLEVAREAEALLAPGLLAGLDRTTCERLVAEGIRTREQLARAPNERLAAATGLDRTRLAALQRDAAALGAVATPPGTVATLRRARAIPMTTRPATTRWSPEPADRSAEGATRWSSRRAARGSELASIEDVAGPFA